MNLYEETEQTQEEQDWFTELINRLKQVLAKLLIKLGIKIAF
ncbi:MAG: hypothetical protein ACI4F5_02515 [Acutalibacteraceae bacterium]